MVRTFLSKYEHDSANTIPRRIDIEPKKMKSLVTLNTVPAVKPLRSSSGRAFYVLANLRTVLNKMIETASFVIPSPKTRENIFG